MKSFPSFVKNSGGLFFFFFSQIWRYRVFNSMMNCNLRKFLNGVLLNSSNHQRAQENSWNLWTVCSKIWGLKPRIVQWKAFEEVWHTQMSREKDDLTSFERCREEDLHRFHYYRLKKNSCLRTESEDNSDQHGLKGPFYLITASRGTTNYRFK